MTPKDKAIELHEDYWSVYYADLADEFTNEYIHEISKKCALICVDEILNVTLQYYQSSMKLVFNSKNYWEEVKKEIEKL